MRANSAGAYTGGQRQPGVAGSSAANRPSRSRSQMTAGYMVATGIGGATLFFILLWAFTTGANDDAPWVPAGLAAGVLVLVAIGAREVVGRQSNARRAPYSERWESTSGETASGRTGSRTLSRNTAALKTLQKMSSEADSGTSPERHLDAYHTCEEYLNGTEELMRGAEISRESRAALRSGQERVRSMQRHHMLMWARVAASQITQDAQQRVRLSDKIETALRGVSVIKTARRHYPDEIELIESEAAIGEFIASVKVAHWVELAERNAFRGQFKRAIDRYHDALFYLGRESLREELRIETSTRIGREIELLRARLRISRAGVDPSATDSKKRDKPDNDRKTVPEM